MKTLALAMISGALLFSCGGEAKKESEENTESVKETCMYSYVRDSTILKWTAYKFTKRVGVSGTFNHIAVNNTKAAENPFDVLVGADFSIHTPSVNSGNVERDPKLVEFFFNKLTDTEMIKGKIVSVNGDEAVVTITINGKSVDVVGKVTVDDTKVSLNTSVDMADFDGLEAVSSLHEVCAAKHTDEDGESILWPDVDIVVSTVLKKECK